MAEAEPLLDKPLSVFEHLEELRKRIIISLGLIVFCAFFAYAYIPRIMAEITRPVGKLYFTEPAEAFWVKVKVALFVGLYFALPLVFFQIWKFIEVGLKQREKIMILPLAFFSFLLFTAGAAFCYFLVIPVAVKFLLSYGSDSLTPLISVSRYVSFLGCLMFAFGLTFQLPLVLLFLARIGLISNKSLREFRRLAIVGAFIIGAVLTPTPDMVNQTLLALPIIVLYELSIWLIKLFEIKGVKNG